LPASNGSKQPRCGATAAAETAIDAQTVPDALLRLMAVPHGRPAAAPSPVPYAPSI
jgi:hypothetical protein